MLNCGINLVLPFKSLFLLEKCESLLTGSCNFFFFFSFGNLILFFICNSILSIRICPPAGNLNSIFCTVLLIIILIEKAADFSILIHNLVLYFYIGTSHGKSKKKEPVSIFTNGFFLSTVWQDRILLDDLYIDNIIACFINS